MSVLTAMNSTPSTSASIMRLTALTPAPPTPTTRSTGSVTSCPTASRRASAPARGRARARGAARARGRGRGCSRGCPTRRPSAGAPRAWARPRSGSSRARGPAAPRAGARALLGAARGLGGAVLEARCRSSWAWRLRHLPGGLRRRLSSGRGRPVRGSLGGLPSSRRGASSRLASGLVVLRLAEELRQGPLAHARPLTACHSPGPPQLAAGRRRPPCRPGRT